MRTISESGAKASEASNDGSMITVQLITIQLNYHTTDFHTTEGHMVVRSEGLVLAS